MFYLELKLQGMGKIILLLCWSFFILLNTKAVAQERNLDDVINLIETGKYEEVHQSVDNLMQEDDPLTRGKAMRIKGQAYQASRDLDQAEKWLKEAIDLNGSIYNREEMAYSLYYLGRTYAFKGDFDKALYNAEFASFLAKEMNNQRLELKINGLLSWTYYMTDQSFNRILDHEMRQFQVVSSVGTELEKAFNYNNFGYTLTIVGMADLDSAISLMEYARAVNAVKEGNNGRWHTLMNLTWQYRLKGDLKKSIEYGEQAFNQSMAIEDRHAIVETAFQLGESLTLSGAIDKAEKYYDIGLEWRGDEKDRDRYVFDVYYAMYLWRKGKKNQAIESLKTAVEYLVNSEVFYEMHGRAILAQYLEAEGSEDEANEQLMFIEKPRNNYISYETRCIAAITRARLLAKKGEPKTALQLLQSWELFMEQMGADLLSNSVKRELELMKQ